MISLSNNITPFYLISIGILLLLVLGFMYWLLYKYKRLKTNMEIKMNQTIDEIKENYKKEQIKEEEETLEHIKYIQADEKWLKMVDDNANRLIEEGKFSIIDLAKAVNLSERQFRRRLKQSTGMLPITYMRELKLSKAELLLKNNAYATVAEVCFAVGFSTPKHFSKLFQEKFGERPSSYLNRSKN